MNTEIPVVRDILIPLEQYPHLRSDEPVGNGVALILQHSSPDQRHLHYEEMLVIDSQDHLVGRLTIGDILTSFFPSILSPLGTGPFVGKRQQYTDLSILLEDSFKRECKRQAAITVGQYMKPPHRSIDADMHLLHAMEIMVKDNENTLPVTDNKVLLGVVRMADLFRVLGTHCTI